MRLVSNVILCCHICKLQRNRNFRLWEYTYSFASHILLPLFSEKHFDFAGISFNINVHDELYDWLLRFALFCIICFYRIFGFQTWKGWPTEIRLYYCSAWIGTGTLSFHSYVFIARQPSLQSSLIIRKNITWTYFYDPI